MNIVWILDKMKLFTRVKRKRLVTEKKVTE